jgi:glycosyltransferase involved in cell wall biosynthesis
MTLPLRVSVVICTRNRPDDLAACLGSLAVQTRRPQQVIVVDASDGDASVAVVERWRAAAGGADVRVIRSRPGLTRQRNRGVDEAGGAVVTFLDDDVVLDPGYLDAIVPLFELDPGIGGVEGTVVMPPLRGRRRLANAVRHLFAMNSLGRRRGVKRSGCVTYDPTPRVPRPVTCLVGCNMSFRRVVFARFRFDEWYDGYGLGEDADFSYRVARRWRLVQTPYARCLHRQSPVARETLPRLQEMAAVNHYYFVRKNLPPTPLTWLCFAWSELGELLAILKTGDRAAIAGTLRGYRRIIREGVT